MIRKENIDVFVNKYIILVDKMNASQLNYIVETGEFITNWLVSDTIEVPFEAKPVPTSFPYYYPGISVKDENGKERVSPAKKEFLETGIFRNSGYPAGITMEQLYYPFDTNKVDFSGVWDFPADITFYAKAYVTSEEAGEHAFTLYASGAVKVWVNGKLEAEFYPYESNIEQCLDVKLLLQDGENEIVVGYNDYGERNIVFKFGMKNLGSAVSVSLPIEADIEKMKRVNRSLQSIYLDKLSYEEGNITFLMEHPMEDEVELEISVSDTKKRFVAAIGMNQIIWGDVAELPIGYQQFTINICVDAVQLTNSLWAEIYPKVLEIETPTSYEERVKATLDFAVNNLKPSLDSYIASLSQGNNAYEKCAKALEHDIKFVQKRGDCSDFRVLRFLWIMHKFRHLLTKEQAKLFEETLLEFRYWFDEPGNDAMWFFSENHALAFHAGELLAGELYPEQIFTNSGLTGNEHKEKAKKRIVEWFEKLLAHGYNEWNSAAYITVDVMTYITLFELSKDEEIKELARRAMDMTYELFARNSYQGVLGTSNGRTYARDLMANKCLASNSCLWLAWGVGRLNQHVAPATYIALSGYRPPKELEKIAKWTKTEQLIVTELQGTNKVSTTLCKTKDYIIGTCVSPRTGYFGSQEHLLNIFLADTDNRIWVNHPGEGKIFGQRRPGYFSGNGLTPMVEQQNNVAVMSYQFPEEMLQRAEVNYTHIFCDSNACDEVVMEGNWVFIRRKKGYVALYSTNGIRMSETPCLKGKEYISTGINGTWFIKASCEKEVGSFEKFRNYFTTHIPVCKNDKLYYEDYQYGNMEFSLMEEGYIRKILASPSAKELGLRSL